MKLVKELIMKKDIWTKVQYIDEVFCIANKYTKKYNEKDILYYENEYKEFFEELLEEVLINVMETSDIEDEMNARLVEYNVNNMIALVEILK